MLPRAPELLSIKAFRNEYWDGRRRREEDNEDWWGCIMD
jgi:hypothetical protein